MHNAGIVLVPSNFIVESEDKIATPFQKIARFEREVFFLLYMFSSLLGPFVVCSIICAIKG